MSPLSHVPCAPSTTPSLPIDEDMAAAILSSFRTPSLTPPSSGQESMELASPSWTGALFPAQSGFWDNAIPTGHNTGNHVVIVNQMNAEAELGEYVALRTRNLPEGEGRDGIVAAGTLANMMIGNQAAASKAKGVPGDLPRWWGNQSMGSLAFGQNDDADETDEDETDDECEVSKPECKRYEELATKVTCSKRLDGPTTTTQKPMDQPSVPKRRKLNGPKARASPIKAGQSAFPVGSVPKSTSKGKQPQRVSEPGTPLTWMSPQTGPSRQAHPLSMPLLTQGPAGQARKRPEHTGPKPYRNFSILNYTPLATIAEETRDERVQPTGETVTSSGRRVMRTKRYNNAEYHMD